jgi:DNA-binding MarR family transcriptional regulator
MELLDVKCFKVENVAMAKVAARAEQDHIDRFLEKIAPEMPTLDLAVEGIVDRLMGLSRRLKRMLDETLEDVGLSSGEWKVLCSLRHSGPPYRSSPGRLADNAELSSAAMTNRLDRMEAAGLIRRLPDPTDRRALLVELTDEGRIKWEQAVDAQAAKEALVASALSGREKEQLNALLRRMMIAFERQEGHGKKKDLG